VAFSLETRWRHLAERPLIDRYNFAYSPHILTAFLRQFNYEFRRVKRDGLLLLTVPAQGPESALQFIATRVELFVARVLLNELFEVF
jgi:hypothetical protein